MIVYVFHSWEELSTAKCVGLLLWCVRIQTTPHRAQGARIWQEKRILHPIPLHQATTIRC